MNATTLSHVLASARRLIRRRVYPTAVAVRDELKGQHCTCVTSNALKQLRESDQLIIPDNLPRPHRGTRYVEDETENPKVIWARAARVQCAGRLLGRNLESKELYRVLPK